MPATIHVDDKLNPNFVAYNLVFGPDTNGLPDITAKDLVKAMKNRGFNMTRKKATKLLHDWCASGQLRWLDGQYVVA